MAELKLNPSISQEVLQKETRRLGLDKPIIVQYGLWAGSFIRGDLAYKHVHVPPPRPSRYAPGIDPMLEKMILKMMQKDPDNRYSSCEAILRASEAILRDGLNNGPHSPAPLKPSPSVS